MTICVLTTRHAADDDRIYHKQVQSLRARFPDLVVVAPPDGARLATDGVRHVEVTKRDGLLGRVRSALEAVAVVRRLDPAIVHFHDFDLLAAVPFLKLLTHARLIYDVHEVFPDVVRDGRRFSPRVRPVAAWLVERVEVAAARLCDGVITAYEAADRPIGRTGRLTRVVFNYPRLSLWEPDPDLAAGLRARYAGRELIVYQGGMSESRGLFHMLEGLARLTARRPAVSLLLLGLRDPALRAETERRALALGVLERLEIVPWVPHEQMASYLSVCRLGLLPLQPLPRYFVGIPIKVLEYMAAGLPVLSAALPNVAGYLESSEAGVTYDSTDAEAFAVAVDRLLSDDALLQRMAASGRKAVRERWSWDVMEPILFDVYEHLLASSGGGGAR